MNTQEATYDEVVMEVSPLLEKLELLWQESTSIQNVVDVLKEIALLAVMDKDLDMKRTTLSCMAVLRKLVKHFKSEKIPLTKPLSFEKFVDCLKERDSFMTLSTLRMNANFLAKFEERFGGLNASTYSSSAIMKVTPMSSTIVHTPEEDADAQLLETSEEIENALDLLLGSMNGATDAGNISSFISRSHLDNTSTLKLEGDSGFEVIKLEVYPYNQVCIYLL